MLNRTTYRYVIIGPWWLASIGSAVSPATAPASVWCHSAVIVEPAAALMMTWERGVTKGFIPPLQMRSEVRDRLTM